ncbi:hypothetical protein LTR28_009108 [Elasticomyces elasticus]|nr:hypothetical protein LTR28_009108 [Elasticomyces elasticus]
MSHIPKQRLNQLSEQLSKPREQLGTFEDIPKIPRIAGDSAGTNSPLGIGRASAHQFAQNGARAVFICDYNTQHLETHKRELASLYPDVDVHARKIDAGDEESVKSVVDEALEKYGRLDIFFANAGINISNKRIYEASADEFMQVMKTNALRYGRTRTKGTSPR